MTDLSALAGESDKGTRLDRFLSEQIESLSRSRAKALIKDGHVSEKRGARVAVQSDPRRAVEPGVTYQVELPAPVPATLAY